MGVGHPLHSEANLTGVLVHDRFLAHKELEGTERSINKSNSLTRFNSLIKIKSIKEGLYLRASDPETIFNRILYCPRLLKMTYCYLEDFPVPNRIMVSSFLKRTKE